MRLPSVVAGKTIKNEQEKVQKVSAKEIFWAADPFEGKVKQVKLLLLSLYIKFHDVLCLIPCAEQRFVPAVKPGMEKNAERSTRQRYCHEAMVDWTKLHKANQSLLTSKLWWNQVVRILPNYGSKLYKTTFPIFSPSEQTTLKKTDGHGDLIADVDTAIISTDWQGRL